MSKHIKKVFHKPTMTRLVLNTRYMEDDIVFIENFFECECNDANLHETDKTPVCNLCGVCNAGAPDVRLADWCAANGLDALGEGEKGFVEFIMRDDVVILM